MTRTVMTIIYAFLSVANYEKILHEPDDFFSVIFAQGVASNLLSLCSEEQIEASSSDVSFCVVAIMLAARNFAVN